MTQKPKKPKAGENIIHSDEGKQTFLKREILAWRDKGLLDDPYNIIEKPIDGQRPLLDILAETLNWFELINDAQRDRSFLKSGEKPHGGYYKVKRGHRWQAMRYEGAIEIRDELSESQFDIICRVFNRAEELRQADTDPAQLNPRPTGQPRFYADLTYRKYGLPTGSKRYAIRKGASMNEAASWVGDRTEEWLVLGLPDPNRRVVNALASYITPDPAIPEDIEIYEAHQLPQCFGFPVDSDVCAAADIHEAALSVERFEGLLPDNSFRTLVGAAKHLQFKLTTLGDMIAKADPADPNSPTISEAVEVGLEREIGIANWRKKGNDKNKEKTEPYRDMAKAILQRDKNRNLTRNKCALMVIREYNLEVDPSAVSKAIKELFQERSNSKESRPKDEWLK